MAKGPHDITQELHESALGALARIECEFGQLHHFLGLAFGIGVQLIAVEPVLSRLLLGAESRLVAAVLLELKMDGLYIPLRRFTGGPPFHAAPFSSQ